MKEEKSTKQWKFPSLDLLDSPIEEKSKSQDIEKTAKIIIHTLRSHNIDADINPAEIKVGPTFTRYPLMPKSPVYISKTISLEKELALAVASPNGTIRIEVLPSENKRIGIEIPNNNRKVLSFRSVVDELKEKLTDPKLIFPVGMDVENKIHMQDIEDLPNLLVAGSTGSGKSLLFDSIMMSIFYTKTPDEVKFIIIDPKVVGYTNYKGNPYLLSEIITDMDQAIDKLKWLVEEAQRRENIITEANVETSQEYNVKLGKNELPDILLFNDELGDVFLKDPALVEKITVNLAKISQKVGIYHLLSTSRPSRDLLTGLIRANIPSRAAFKLHTRDSSKVLINQPGAEKLLGRGDMLFLSPDMQTPFRLQGTYVSPDESRRVVEFIKKENKC